jgi:hypothetical protein
MLGLGLGSMGSLVVRERLTCKQNSCKSALVLLGFAFEPVIGRLAERQQPTGQWVAC